MVRKTTDLTKIIETGLVQLEHSLKQNEKLSNSEWICKYTKIFDKFSGSFVPFSFKNHEYQLDMVNADVRKVNIMKGCQIGATEIFVRLALALTANMNLTVILTQPDFKMSAGFSKSRINPVIESSPELKALVKDSNSVDLKNIGNGFLHVKYTKGAESHALSVPADVIISDEVDQSDQKNLSLFQSRLEHSKLQWTRNFGTPTVPGYGISVSFEGEEYFTYGIKCPHCGKWNLFLANKPPVDNLIGFDKIKEEFLDGAPDFPILYKDKVRELLDSVYIGCKYCRKSLEYPDRLLLPDSSNQITPIEPQYEWINLSDKQVTDTKNFYINQLATGLKTGRQVIYSFLGYEEMRDIYNQTFGQPFISASERLLKKDIYIERDVTIDTPPFSFMGVDFGLKTNYVLIVPDYSNERDYLFEYGELPLFTVEDEDYVITKLIEVMKQYNVLCAVVDAMPYQNAVNKLKLKSPIPVVDCYLNDRIKKTTFKEKDMTVNGNRSFHIAAMISRFKNKDVICTNNINKHADKEEFLSNFEKFIRVKNRDGSFTYPSMKPDHYGFAYMYANLAKVLSTEFNLNLDVSVDSDVYKIGSFKVNNGE